MRRITVAASAALLAMAGATAALAQTQPENPEPKWVPPAPGQPVERGALQGNKLPAAFPGQTRAPYRPTNVDFKVETVAQGLEYPWALAFLPDGRMLVTEKVGRLRIVSPDGKVSPGVANVPSVDARSGGGLLDLALDEDFKANGMIYWCAAEDTGDGISVTLHRAKLVLDKAPHLDEVRTLFRARPNLDSIRGFGCRMVFPGDGTVIMATGDHDYPEFRHFTQQMDNTVGKVIRVGLDGRVPRDNPFVDKPGVAPEIWAVGVRNALGLAIDPATGKVWETENGPRGGDELNQIEPGRNYGWPVISYGMEYSGLPVGEGTAQKAGMEQPVYYWDPVIAPSGLMVYSGDLFPAWKGSLFVGSLRRRHLDRLDLKDGQVVGEERLLTDLNERIRDVRQGPDGAIWVLTDDQNGKLLKLTPR